MYIYSITLEPRIRQDKDPVRSLLTWLTGSSNSNYGSKCKTWINSEHGLLVF